MARQDVDPDTFWNESSVKPLSFDDEETGGQFFGVSKSGTARLSHQVGVTLPSEFGFPTDSLTGLYSHSEGIPTPPVPPLLTLISEKALNAILKADFTEPEQLSKAGLDLNEELRMLRRQVLERWREPPIETTIQNMFLGRPYSLELFRSLSSKRSLLDASIALGDGNVILKIVLFLEKTLKRSIFHQTLLSHPIAATHYIKYLDTRLQISELTDLLEFLGRSRDAGMKQFQMCTTSQDPSRQLKKLETCLSSPFIQSDSKFIQLVKNYISLIEWQQAVGVMDKTNLFGTSVLECLAHACRIHWNAPQQSPTNPIAFSQVHKVCEQQRQWVILTERATLKCWSDIDSVFVIKNWLGSGSKLKLALPIEEFLTQLHNKEAPSDILIKYFGYIDNTEKRMALARKINCHKVVITGYMSLRDRQGLQSYKATLHPKSEAFLQAEWALHNSDTKWKN